MIDAKKIYLHSPILTDDKVIAAFYQEISQQPKLLFKDDFCF
ncbi:ROK family protein, partial [human gut metagenome]